MFLNLHGVLHHSPLIIALAYVVPQMASLRRRRDLVATPAPYKVWQRLRITLQIGVAFVIGVLLVVEGVGTSFPFVTAFSALVSLLVASLMAYIELYKGFKPSDSLLVYWLTFSCFQLVILSSHSVSKSKTWDFDFELWITLGCVVSFVLEWLQPRRVPTNLHYQNPYDQADLFSRLVFHWMSPLMQTGYSKYLEASDLPRVARKDRTYACSHKLEKYWNIELERFYDSRVNPSLYYRDVFYRVSLGKALIKAFGWRYLASSLFKLISDIAAYAQPWLLKSLIAFVTNYYRNEESLKPGVYISVALFIVANVQSLALHQHFERAFNTGMVARTSVSHEIYKKALKLSDKSSERSIGETINLMSVDTQRLQDFCPNGNMLWSGPLQILFCMVSLYKLVGHSMWFGIAVMLVLTPLNSYMAVFQKKMQKQQMKNKDLRIRLVSELFSAIKSIKLYSWENPFVKNLDTVRNVKELGGLKRILTFQALLMNLWTFAPFIVTCVTFSACSLLSTKPLTVDIVFPCLALFQLLGPPMSITPNVITNFIEANIALTRIADFLISDEIQPRAIERLDVTNTDFGVEITDASFAFNAADAAADLRALKHVDLKVKRGELACVVGKVGSGKSALLLAMIGDIYKCDGSVKLAGEVAYVPQRPWLFNGTVRDNILFGRVYDESVYKETVSACALNEDLAVLPDGDMSFVGEKGLSLSGGQKARISLARAVYARADVYLLDDPLSAVDEHVGRHIVHNVLGKTSGLIKDKTVILVTNNIPVLSHADKVVLLVNGEISEQGNLEEDLPQIEALVSEFGAFANDANSDTSSESSESEGELSLRIDHAKLNVRPPLAPLAPLDPSMNAEHSEVGKVDFSVYREYAKVCGFKRIALFVTLLALAAVASLQANIWLKRWAEDNTKHERNVAVFYYLGVYIAISSFSSLFSLLQNLVSYVYININAARTLHENMLHSIVKCPMSFFELTPLGRIVNRFSTDMYKVDQQLARSVPSVIANYAKVVVILAVVLYTTPLVMLVFIPLGFVYYRIQQYYLKTSRELKRLDSVSKSPIFAQFHETLDGLSSIRAYNASSRFEFVNKRNLDNNNRAYFPSVSSNRWLATRIEFLGSLIILSASILAVYSLPSKRVSAGVIGLSLTYVLQVSSAMNWLVIMSAEVENNIVSVERILEFTNLKHESGSSLQPPANWPASGTVEFEHYSSKYRQDLPLVLKDINLRISDGEKVGVVGRTGAGKSSLVLALFRLIEATKGTISIDDVRTNKLELHALRSKLGVIPQDSHVFEGSIRFNLDPLSVHTNAELWRALELSHLKEHVKNMPGALDAKVYENGKNLSAGQKQLLALARVLLTDFKVLVLDEATAAVDFQTDKLVQEVIKTEFKEKTVITVAHRLNTIVNNDKIVVMDFGEIVECDSPQTLMSSDSKFQEICRVSGIPLDA